MFSGRHRTQPRTAGDEKLPRRPGHDRSRGGNVQKAPERRNVARPQRHVHCGPDRATAELPASGRIFRRKKVNGCVCGESEGKSEEDFERELRHSVAGESQPRRQPHQDLLFGAALRFEAGPDARPGRRPDTRNFLLGPRGRPAGRGKRPDGDPERRRGLSFRSYYLKVKNKN